jgi:hypothetical protein
MRFRCHPRFVSHAFSMRVWRPFFVVLGEFGSQGSGEGSATRAFSLIGLARRVC